MSLMTVRNQFNPRSSRILSKSPWLEPSRKFGVVERKKIGYESSLAREESWDGTKAKHFYFFPSRYAPSFPLIQILDFLTVARYELK